MTESTPAAARSAAKSPRSGPWMLAFAIVVLCISWFAGKGFNEAQAHGKDLTLDVYGEADVVRAANRFVDFGLFDHYGIPDVAYGDLFAKQGGKFDKQELCAEPHDCFYTHNPPGSVYLYALVSKLYTPSIPYLARLINVLFCVGAIAVFLRAVWRWLSPARAAVMAVLLTQIPMVYHHAQGICYHGHLMAFLFIELALALAIVQSGKATPGKLIGLGAVTFVSGWFSYEFAFICAFAPLLLSFLRDDWRSRENLKRAAILTLVAGGGFTLAQLLHLAQSAAFFGSFSAAWTDLVKAGAKRTVGAGSVHRNTFPLGHPIGTWLAYWTNVVGRGDFFNGNFFAWLITACTVFALPGTDRELGRIRGYRIDWLPRRRYVFVVLGALAVASMWITAMPQHASVHTHFLPRQFMLVCLVVMLISARLLRVTRESTDGGASS